ncbi:MAG TPA: DUF4349 domain-containing protein [Streptosporangiaceae bacterium]|nr:DUF4349 domain-containing protein [Streptosporangiaceae bacterium]
MNTNVPALASRTGLRATVITVAAVMAGASLLLAGCSNGSLSASPSTAGHRMAGIQGSAAAGAGAAQAPAPAPGALSAQAAGRPQSARTARLVVPGQSIIYTAGLTVRAQNVASAASLAISIVTSAGGYVAGEQASIHPPGHARPTVSLQLKIPVAAYPAALRQLAGRLGSQTSLSQQAQDVTGQVADVTSRVASAQAAIAQLRALLRRAGSVGGLLGVQDQINAEESTLEALQAQQRALSRETTYATVALRLVSKHAPSVIKKKQSHGFLAGLSAGWRALRVATSWVLTAAGTALPFAVLAALLAGIGYGGRRRVRRRRPPATTPPPTTAS